MFFSLCKSNWYFNIKKFCSSWRVEDETLVQDVIVICSYHIWVDKNHKNQHNIQKTGTKNKKAIQRQKNPPSNLHNRIFRGDKRTAILDQVALICSLFRFRNQFQLNHPRCLFWGQMKKDLDKSSHRVSTQKCANTNMHTQSLGVYDCNITQSWWAQRQR